MIYIHVCSTELQIKRALFVLRGLLPLDTRWESCVPWDNSTGSVGLDV